MLPTQLVLDEVESAKKILDAIADRLAKGVPGIDTPGSEESAEQFIAQVASELLLVAGKCGNLAETVSNP